MRRHRSLTFGIEDPMFHRLEVLARSEGRSVSYVIRRLLDIGLVLEDRTAKTRESGPTMELST